MGASSSKAPKKSSSTFPRFASVNKRASKRILMPNSAIYPSNLPSNKTSETVEHNNNSLKSLTNDDANVVIRNKNNGLASDESFGSLTPKSSKKEKKKKKSDMAVSGEDTVSTYHKTNVCYYMVENGKFLKLPSDTKHKSNDGCYVKLSNGSFRHLMVPDGSHQEVNVKTVRQSMPVQKTSEKEKDRSEERQPQNRKIMVTMIDGGLPVVAVSKRDKTAHLKKDKDKIKVITSHFTNHFKAQVCNLKLKRIEFEIDRLNV